MSQINKYAWIILICVSLRTSRAADDSFFGLSTTTSDQKFTPNGNVTFICTVFKSRTGVADGIQWFRRQGTVSLRIATEFMPNPDFNMNSRYQYNRGGETSTTVTYSLTISNLRLEDSATVECGIPRFSQRASFSFAVCANPGNKSCDCMVETGWASPWCFNNLIEAKNSYESCHRAIIGLGIGLALMATIAALLTVWFIKSGINQIKAALRKKRSKSESTVSLTPAPTKPLATPGASVLKNPSRSSPSGGHSVHFSDDSGTPKQSGNRSKDSSSGSSDSSYAYTGRVSFMPASANTVQKQPRTDVGNKKPRNSPSSSYSSNNSSYSERPYASEQSGGPPGAHTFQYRNPAFIDPGSTSV